MIIKNLCDSHIHLLMTGETFTQINLSSLRNHKDLVQVSSQSQNSRGWILGFGWDENHFEPGFQLNRKILDEVFPGQCVLFVRTDGHSSCVSTQVLQRMGISFTADFSFAADRQFVGVDENGIPNGILKESAHMKVYEILPPPEKSQIKKSLELALKYFHSQGFTHLRDMTTRWPQWEASLEMHEQGTFQAFVEHNFSCENRDDLDRALRELRDARKTENAFMKARGVKFFYDGSLGSRTAALSQSYADETNNSGCTLWSKENVKELISRSWDENFDVSVHVIGDRAVHEVVECARQISASGKVGHLNLEHVQVLRPETLKLMKPLHVTCHLQPCHWLSDQAWLQERLGLLQEFAFPWEALRKSGIKIRFGSDSPIEKPSLERNLMALKESSRKGIKEFKEDPLVHHSCQFLDVPVGETQLSLNPHASLSIDKVFFNQKLVYENQF